MKKLSTLLLGAMLVFSFAANAQYYIVSNTSPGQNPGNINNDNEFPLNGGLPAGWTNIFTGTANTSTSPSWTATQTVPFPFQFDGTTVASYKVSTNGVVTFDIAATRNPTSTNSTIPSTLIPNNSVVLWGLFAGGAGDYILTKTFGTTPNRQHWIHFNSYSTMGAGWSYWSVVLEETTNKIYVVDQRTNTGPNTLTVGIQINDTSAIQLLGSPNITTLTTNGSTPADNAYYEFIPGTQPTDDASLEALNLPNPVSGATPISISGDIKNLGSAILASVEVNWRVNGSATINTDTISLNLASNSQGSFTHGISWSPTVLGQNYDLDVWTSNPNGSMDGNMLNDTIKTTVFVNLGNTVQKNAVLEQFTTAVCQFCPDGAWVAEQINNNYQNVYATSVHSCFGTDGMTNAEASALCSTLGINAAPTAMVDRKLFDGETDVAFGRGSGYPAWASSTWATRSLAQSNLGAPVDVNISGSYNPATRGINVNVDASFVDYILPGRDVRVSLQLIEDSVTGVGSQYNQVNAYNGQTGHPFAGRGNPIVGYQHKRVLRDILPNTWGDNTVIPTSYALNTNYTRNFTYTLPSAYDPAQMYLIATVNYFGGANIAEYEILNAKRVKLSLITSVEEAKADLTTFKIYPNPTDLPFTNVEFKLSEQTRIEARIMDVTGKEVAYQDFGVMSQGSQRIQLETADLKNGFYFVNFRVGDQQISKKISVLK